jgi:hypothetical protein
MSSDHYKPLMSEPSARLEFVKFVGGSAAVTKVHGSGVTVTYISTGIVDITWSSNAVPGTFLGLLGAPAFQATTAADVKGHTCVPGVYNTTTRTLRLNITNASDALHDLAALEWLSFTAVFRA